MPEIRSLSMKFIGKIIEYHVKLQIVSLPLQIAVISETSVSTFLQIGFNLFANPVSPFLQIWYHPFCKFSFNLFANEGLSGDPIDELILQADNISAVLIINYDGVFDARSIAPFEQVWCRT